MLIKPNSESDYYDTYDLETMLCYNFDKIDKKKIIYTLLISLAEHGSRDIQLNILNNLLPGYIEVRK
jgi:hypothetical protein